MKKVELEVETWNRFKVTGVWAEPELLGMFHEFIFDQYQIRIELPSKDDIPKEGIEGDKLSFHFYREIDGRKIPVQFWVHTVDISVLLPNKIRFPEQILAQPPNVYELFSENQQNSLNMEANKYNEVAKNAFDVWLRTLRWKCNSSEIGRPEIDNFETGWSTYLVDKASKKPIWIATRTFTLRGGTLVTIKHWNEVGNALKNGLRPPVYYDSIFDAVEHMKIGDLQRTVIDLAVACESYLRISVMGHLPDNLSNSLRHYIDKANINQYISYFFLESLNEQEKRQFTKLSEGLDKLFNARNTIMHSGRKTDLTLAECRKYLEITQKLISIKDGSKGTDIPVK